MESDDANPRDPLSIALVVGLAALLLLCVILVFVANRHPPNPPAYACQLERHESVSLRPPHLPSPATHLPCVFSFRAADDPVYRRAVPSYRPVHTVYLVCLPS